jgi:glycosyltransferase involved in cell wall biosynthesis
MQSLEHQKKISVAWLANTFIDRASSGTGRVAKNLVEVLAVKYPDQIEIVLICDSYTNLQIIDQYYRVHPYHIVELPKLRINKFRSIRQYFLAKRVLNYKIDIMHFMLPRQYPFFFKFPARIFISTYHAGGDITAPSEKLVLSRHIYNWVGKTQNRNLSKVVAVSRLAKNEISDAYNICTDRIEVIPIGTDHLWDLQDIPRQEEKNYILIVGRWQKYKNMHVVLDCISKHRNFFSKNYKIIVLASRRNESKSMSYADRLMDNFGMDEIVNIEKVTDAELKSLYKHASLVIYPSNNEGFGLPPFEAFGEGAPVLIHNNTPAADYLKNRNGVFIANLSENNENTFKALEKALVQRSRNFQENRDFLKTLGFTWDEMARKYLSLYQELNDV